MAGKPDTNAGDYYTQTAGRVIDRRSQLGLFHAPADVDSVEGVSAATKTWVKANTVVGPFVLLSAENVGPQVGADLQKKALLAIIWSTVGMLAYIAFRFRSVPFGVGAIVALIHDTLITVGLLALFGREFNLVVVAALLTLVGYSVNDTVVVYDRVRENLRTPKKEPLEAVINRSINQTLSRTILTSGATMLVVVALFFLGGEVLQHVRADAHHRHRHRHVLVDLRRGRDRRDLEGLEDRPEAGGGARPRQGRAGPAGRPDRQEEAKRSLSRRRRDPSRVRRHSPLSSRRE